MTSISSPRLQPPANLGRPRCDQQSGRQSHSGACKALDGGPRTGLTQDGPRDRRPNQHAERPDEERLPGPGAQRAQVRRQAYQGHWQQADKPAGEEAIQDGKRHGRGELGDTAPREHQDPRDGGNGNVYVERADHPGDQIRRDASKRRRRVHDGQQVKGKLRARHPGRLSIQTHIKQRHKDPYESAEGGCAEERVLKFPKGRHIDQLSLASRSQAWSHDGHADRYRRHGQEPQDARRPAKADVSLESDKGERHDDPADTRARGSDAVCHRVLGGEVLRENGDRGHEQAAVADANEDALGDDRLPVLSAQAGHHKSQRNQDAASDNEVTKVSGIIKRPGEDSDQRSEECLDGPNPRDV